MRRMKARFDQEVTDVRRVVALDSLAKEWTPDLRFAVKVNSEQERQRIDSMRGVGGIDVAWLEAEDLQPGDIITTRPGRQELTVLYRESDLHHSLFMTNRCNSYCLMCSQPPTKQDDSWLTRQAQEIVQHIRVSPTALGITGGEPLLLGQNLRNVLDVIAEHHPETRVEVLTNGRLFSDVMLARSLLTDLRTKSAWLVPLYGHADFVHDFVVQSPGAFEETIAGLLVLREYKQTIQLRIVLVLPVLQVLEHLCGFIGRNLPFVREVALMACEPTGFALANREECEVDLGEWGKTLEAAASVLKRYGIPFLFMNSPLCSLPRSLWFAAHKSISDWKNVYPTECDGCAVKPSCSGLFAWHESGWRPSKIGAVKEAVHE